MTIDEINMPVFVQAFQIAYDNNKDYKYSDYEDLLNKLKKETNVIYHMMNETMVYIKK